MLSEKEKFLIGQEIHRQREEESLFYKKRYEEEKKSIRNCDNSKIAIGQVALDLLEGLGFERENRGTIFLSSIIENLYHERKIFNQDNKFFDFNDRNNNHYIFLKEYYECSLVVILKAIREEIAKSFLSDKSLNDIIYSVTNDIISQYDRCQEQLIYEKK